MGYDACAKIVIEDSASRVWRSPANEIVMTVDSGGLHCDGTVGPERMHDGRPSQFRTPGWTISMSWWLSR